MKDFEILLEKYPETVTTNRFVAEIFARKNDRERAFKHLSVYSEFTKNIANVAVETFVVSCYFGEEEGLSQQLAVLIDDSEPASLYAVAVAYSRASGVYRSKDDVKADRYAEMAIKMLRRAVDAGYVKFLSMQQDPNMDPIRDSEQFRACISKGNLRLRYNGFSNTSPELRSAIHYGRNPEQHLKQCRRLADSGYRPAEVSAAWVDGRVVTASAWHVPLVDSQVLEHSAKRKANAVIASIKLGDFESGRDFLQHSPDPSTRSWVIHRLQALGVSHNELTSLLERVSDSGSRQAIVLALGRYSEIDAVDRDAIAERLIELYREEPDPGVHAALEWTLRRFGKSVELSQIDDSIRSSLPTKDRGWYVNGQGQTMVVVPGPSETWIGSPRSEPNRLENEHLHRRRIDRTYAIANKEVTVGQAAAFLESYPAFESTSDDSVGGTDYPRNLMTWYFAVAYCRWLSEQEGIAEEEMCYPEIEKIRPGMRLPRDFLSRTGYRLPTLVEWENACRAGTRTARFFGRTEELLPEYDWYSRPLMLDGPRPVGQKMPNPLGLFDIYGNVSELVQNRSRSYSYYLSRVFPDDEIEEVDSSGLRRIIRGASYSSTTRHMRSGFTSSTTSTLRSFGQGFRIARTLRHFSTDD